MERCGGETSGARYARNGSVPSKHLAAVIYMVGREIDNNPFLVFKLHGVDIIGELAKRGIAIVSTLDNAILKLLPVSPAFSSDDACLETDLQPSGTISKEW